MDRVRREELADALKVLGSTTRLDILSRLRVSSTVADLTVPAARHRPDEQVGRPIASATAREHLAKLVASGLAVEQREPSGPVTYRVNRLRLYALAEAFRALAIIPADEALDVDQTRQLQVAHPPHPMAGPRLVLVHGAYEGRVFPLTGRDAGARWTIGRRAGLDVRLDYDPFVSRVHAHVEQHDNGHVVVDATGSQNGTRLNWNLLTKGDPVPLRAGDVLSVGRSLLVYAR